MKEMVTAQDPNCPFEFNFDPATFKVGDIVSYRVPEAFGDMPFVGQLVVVEEEFVILSHFGVPETEQKSMRGTRESRPVVSEKEALGEK